MFNYNPKILDLLGGDTKVICAGLGTGKTQSMKQYLSTTTEQILVIVNDIEAQEAFIIDLPNITVYNSNTPDSFYETIRNLNKNHLIITKAKFNQLLTLGDNVFNMFDKIFIDEASGLSPIQLSSMEDSIKSIVRTLETTITKDTELYNRNIHIIDCIKVMLNDIYYCEEFTPFYKYKIGFDTTYLAKNFRLELIELYEKNLAYDIPNFISLLNFMSAIENDSVYLGDRMMGSKKQTSVIYANLHLKEYIANAKAKIIILDATATIVEDLYIYLGIPIVEVERKEYPNLILHVHRYDHLTPSKGRKNVDITQKILDDIKESGRENYLTFSTKFSMELLDENGFTNTDYVFSGRDIGSNIYREHDTMNIVYSNSYPMHYRAIFNKIILGIDTEDCFTPVNLKIAENILMSERLCQLVGRLSIRVDSNNHNEVHFYCVSQSSIDRVQEYFGIPDEHVIFHKSIDIGLPKKSVKLESVLYRIETELKRRYEGKIIDLKRLIRANFYTIETPQKTIGNWYQGKNKIEIEKLISKYNARLEIKKGRNGGTYIFM